MTKAGLRGCFGIALIIAAIAWAFCAPAGAQVPRVPDGPAVQVQFQIIHAFGGPGDGIGPGGGMVMDSKGNLYGVTGAGGAQGGGGTVYELSPGANGPWTETILHSFPIKAPSDGFEPIGMVIDGAGNLYGTTLFGGDGQYCFKWDYNGCGTVFELSPGANGEWTESILWNFCSLSDCADGTDPLVAPTLGPGGSLYGVAGTAFQLTPGSGGWTFTLLYTFCGIGPDCPTGSQPSSSLTLDAGGNLYGETSTGGDCSDNLGCGVVYVLHQQTNGQWKEVVLHDFGSMEDGDGPTGGLTFHDGGLYGVTEGGGDGCLPGCGTAFELTRGSGNNINEQIFWNFGGDGGAQGVSPGGGVVFNNQGDMFGVTGLGGEGGYGIVYGMKPEQNGKWAYAVLHTFDGSDGVEPETVTIDSKGDLFGTTGGGGAIGGGVAFELSPVKQGR